MGCAATDEAGRAACMCDTLCEAATLTGAGLNPGAAGEAARLSPLNARPQRIGGAYWMPALFHSAFRPRAICSFDPEPMLR